MSTVCVVGAGAREHALATVLGRHADVVITPGWPGVSGSTNVAPTDLDADLFVIGPEVPLVDGLADELRGQGKVVFGPGADGAQLEGSKAWMKEVLSNAEVPTAQYAAFTEVEPALAYLDTMGDLFIVKTDGLAAGKGVTVTEDRAEAEDAIHRYLSGEAFGDAGRRLVIEEGLTGPEISVFAICDGKRAVALEPAQDFKRIGVGDTGPNTGGMGAYSPVPTAPSDLIDEVMDRFVGPTLHQLQSQGIDYRGALFAGLMLTPDGPKMLEYNVRFGDPETQVVLPRVESNVFDLFFEAATGNLTSAPTFTTDAMVTVVCAAEGYPVAPVKGAVISGIDEAQALDGVEVFYSGVATNDDGALLVNGGRVVNVVGRGATLGDARAKAFAGVDKISWPGMQYRTDIAEEAAQVVDITNAADDPANDDPANGASKVAG